MQSCTAWHPFVTSVVLWTTVQLHPDCTDWPGFADVAVEHIFSGGHDTISVHHASLSAETIQTLMLVKQWLHLPHTTIDELLCN